MKAAFFTLGCKVNQYETEILIDQFKTHGFEIAPDHEPADVYIVNSCTVTATSDKKCRQALRRFRRQNPNSVVCLCGCMPQAFPDQAAGIQEADIVMGTADRSKVLQAVLDKLEHGGRIVNVEAYHKEYGFEPMQIHRFQEHTRAFVKIQDGCERYCSYCIIPHARGPVRSKPLEEIREELNALASNGYREVVLVGINLSCYGQDTGDGLVDAVELACGIKGLERVRLGSLEPDLITDSNIALMSKLPSFCPQFHLSLQSGSDATLKRMNRMYDKAGYRYVVDSIRRHFPDSSITTDIMVGFPGETAGEFEESLEFVKEIGFARSHIFPYSPRPGTPAAKMQGQVPEHEKSARSKKMIQLTNQSRNDFLDAQVGKEVSVLFETKLDDGRWEGYSKNFTAVRARSEEGLESQVCTVKLTSVDQDGCEGEIL